MRIALDEVSIETRPLWKPMHCQPVYANAPAYINGVSEALFKVGLCLPAGPYVTDDDVQYIVEQIKNAIKWYISWLNFICIDELHKLEKEYE